MMELPPPASGPSPGSNGFESRDAIEFYGLQELSPRLDQRRVKDEPTPVVCTNRQNVDAGIGGVESDGVDRSGLERSDVNDAVGPQESSIDRGKPEEGEKTDPVPMGEEANPDRLAREFLKRYFDLQNRFNPDGLSLRYWKGDFYAFQKSCYRPQPANELNALITRHITADFDNQHEKALERFRFSKAEDPPKKLNVTKSLVSNVALAIKSRCLLTESEHPDQGGWIHTVGPWEAEETIATRNHYSHLPSLASESPRSISPTPGLFVTSALPIDFDPAAPEPTHWLRVLDEIWPNDAGSIRLLRQWMGYLISGSKTHQKIMVICGPPRSGKGTIAKVIQSLVGKGNYANPSLNDLGSDFGMQSLVGKKNAIITDARHARRPEANMVALERILVTSGGDEIAFRRKHLPDWTGDPAIRWTIMGNLPPDFEDPSGAWAARLLVLRMIRSFTGREDFHLFEGKLKPEFSGILKWAVGGWTDLREQGRFSEPPASIAERETLRRDASELSEFADDRLVVEAGGTARKDDVFAAWLAWCKPRNRRPGDASLFARDLRAALPGIKDSRPYGDDGKRFHAWEGIRLLPAGRVALSPAGSWLRIYLSRGLAEQSEVIDQAGSFGIGPAAVFEAAREIGAVADEWLGKKTWTLPPGSS